MYELRLRINDEHIYDILSVDEPIKNKRAEWLIKKNKNKTEILINAVDSVVLRAILNGITKSLTVYENILKLKNECNQ